MEWAENMGGWEAPCWERLRAVCSGFKRLFGSAEGSHKDAPEIAPHKAKEALQAVFDLLYLDMGPQGDFYNPDKAWDSDVIDAVAEVVRPFFNHLLQNKKECDDQAL